MKRIRKILIRVGGVLVGLILVLFLLGYFFEDRLHLMAIRELSDALHARIDVKDTHVSFLRSWPDVNVQLEGVSINPMDAEPGSDVITIASAELDIYFWSFFSDRMEIKSVLLDEPTAHLTVDKEGNWNTGDMFQPPKDSTKSSDDSEELVFDLSGVSIEDGIFAMKDDLTGADMRIDSIYLDLSGDFSASRTDFDTEMAFHLARWKDKGLNWAGDKHVSLDILADASLDSLQIFRIREAEAQVAGVTLNWGGEISEEANGYRMNLAYNTSRNDFDAFMSLLPGGLLETGRDYEYDGEFNMHGWVRGLAGNGTIPSIYAEYAVTNGAFHYVDYDSRLTGIQLSGSCMYEENDPTQSWFKVDTLVAHLRDHPVYGALAYENFKDPHLDCQVHGRLALEDIREFYPDFADSSKLAGLVDVDLMVDGRIADFKEKRYSAVRAKGALDMEEVRIEDRRVRHPIEGLTGHVKVDNHRIQVSELAGKVGKSDFEVKGMITEYLPWFFGKDARVVGLLELKSDNMDLNDWIVEEEGEAVDGSQDRFAFRLPDNVDVDVRAKVGHLRVAKLEASQVSGQVRLYDKRINLERLIMNTLDGSLVLTGSLHAQRPELCEVRIDATAQQIDINKGFRTFDQLAAFALVEENLYGQFSGDLHIEGQLNQYLDLDPNSLVSYGTVTLKNGRLKDFEPLEGLAGFVKMEDLRDLQFSDVTTNFQVENGYFYLPGVYVEANDYKMDVSGRHGFDNTLDYRVAVELPRKAARQSGSSEIRSLVDIAPEEKARIMVPVRITGTVDHPKYALDGQFVKNSIEDKVEAEKEEVKVAFNEEIEEEFGGVDSMEVDDLIVVEKDPSDTSKVAGVLDKIKNPLKKLKWPVKKKKGGGLD